MWIRVPPTEPMTQTFISQTHKTGVNIGMPKLKYSKEEIERFAWLARSHRDLLIKLGEPIGGRVDYRHELRDLKKCLAFYGLNYAHFTGQSWNKGRIAISPIKPIEDYFAGSKISSNVLKKKLILFGYKRHECEVCKRTEWNNRPIPIQLHHINGDSSDNQFVNLQILCANCHAQTDNFCRGQRKTVNRVSDEVILEAVKRSFSISEVLIKSGMSSSYANYPRIKKLLTKHQIQLNVRVRDNSATKIPDPNWRTRPRPESRKIVWPTKEILEDLVANKPMIAVARELGVSDSSVRKACRRLNIPLTNRLGFWAKKRSEESKAGVC